MALKQNSMLSSFFQVFIYYKSNTTLIKDDGEMAHWKKVFFVGN